MKPVEASSMPEFVKIYNLVRDKEQWTYTDEDVFRLPDVGRTDPHKKEWQARKFSSSGLINYLRNHPKPLRILEVGCGNGWLCNRLSQIPNVSITGIDINTVEIEQARRVFHQTVSLQFIEGELDPLLLPAKFDIIIFAASIQYFPSLAHTVSVAFNCLKISGEIHILDSPLYRSQEVEAARNRSREYYFLTGFPEMSAYYFHHAFSELEEFNYSILYNPHALYRKLTGIPNPFYWIRIKT